MTSTVPHYHCAWQSISSEQIEFELPCAQHGIDDIDQKADWHRPGVPRRAVKDASGPAKIS
jgi:hypothetical protein